MLFSVFSTSLLGNIAALTALTAQELTGGTLGTAPGTVVYKVDNFTYSPFSCQHSLLLGLIMDHSWVLEQRLPGFSRHKSR